MRIDGQTKGHKTDEEKSKEKEEEKKKLKKTIRRHLEVHAAIWQRTKDKCTHRNKWKHHRAGKRFHCSECKHEVSYEQLKEEGISFSVDELEEIEEQ